MTVDEAGRRIYLWGGSDADGFFQDLWVFDPDQHLWRMIAVDDAPLARSGHSLVFDPGSRRLVLFGGIGFSSWGEISFYSDLWFFSEDDGWSRELAGAGPSGRAWHAALVAGGKMVVFGGFGGSPHYHQRDIWSLDLSASSFGRLATDGGPQMAGSAVLLHSGGDHESLMVFGRNGVVNPRRAGLWSLEVKSDSWTPVEIRGEPDPDFDFAAGDAGGTTVLVARGSAEEDRDRLWRFWSWSVGDSDWHRFEAENGPAVAHRMACASHPGRPGAWICFGGARRELVGGETWLLGPCSADSGEP